MKMKLMYCIRSILILGLLFSAAMIFAQCESVSNSIGLNYQFYHDGQLSKIDGIANRWRQFTAWHNLGYDGEKCANTDYVPDPPVYNHPFYDPANPDVFMPTWKYNPNNFIDDNGINKNIQSLITNGSAEMAFPTMTLTHPFLGTDRYYDDDQWKITSPNDQNAGWRKPVPFVISGNGIIVDPNESFTNPESYRFYVDHLEYYLGMFGDNFPSSNLNSYEVNPQELAQGWNQYIELWNEPTAHWTKPNDFGYFKPQELAAMVYAVISGDEIDQCIDDDKTDCQNTTPICIPDVQVGGAGLTNSISLISPAPHEMDVNYFIDFMTALRLLEPGYNFDVNAFHHYSAYRGSDLSTGMTADDIVANSVSNNQKDIPYDLNTTEKIFTVNLESAPFTDAGYWICPELDGYRERGTAIKNALNANTITGDIWVTEWGYSTLVSHKAAKYPPAYQGKEEEAQARWLMRGFLEYDQSDIGASFWHWYQDGEGAEWDQAAGIIDFSGNRKTAWYYLHTLNNEIGNKRADGEFALDGCTLGWEPSITVENNIVTPKPPINLCPRIYKYVGESDCNAPCLEYNDAVWVIWLPYMIDKKETIAISLDDLGVDAQTEFPQYYYYNTPKNGKKNGVNSELKPISIDNNGNGVVQIPVSEKPIFLHLQGESSCPVDTNPTGTPTGCGPVSMNAYVENPVTDITCSTIKVKVTVYPKATCTIAIDLNTLIGSIGTNNIGTEFDHAVIVDVLPGSNANEFYVIFGELVSGVDYNFSLGVEYSANGENGYVSTETDVETTNSMNCFSDITITADVDNIIMGCTDAQINVYINIPAAYTTADLLTLEIISTLYELDQGNNQGPGQVLNAVGFIDWVDDPNNSNQMIAIVLLENLSPDTEYDFEYSLAENAGAIFVGPQTASVDIGSNGEPNSLGCDNGPGKVCDIAITSDDDCLYSFCFAPLVAADQNTVYEYRLEVRDQDGNEFIWFEDFYPDPDNNPPPTPPLCFSNIDLSGLTVEPFIVQVVAIYDRQSTNGCKLQVTTCCTPSILEVDPIFYFYNCYSSYVHAIVCVDEGASNCHTDYTLQYELPNGTSFTPSSSTHGENCHFLWFEKDKFLCTDLNYTVNIVVNGQVVDSAPISWPFGQCTYCPPDWGGPVQGYVINTTHYTSDGDNIFYDGEIGTTLYNLVDAVRGTDPVYYVLTDNNDPSFISIKPYLGRIALTLPERTYNAATFNSRFNVHLLAGDEFFILEFPDDSTPRLSKPETVEENELNIYPNPSKGRFMVDSEVPILNVEVFSAAGVMVAQTKPNALNFNCSVPNRPGIYYVKMLTAKGDTICKKIIIQ